MEETILSVINQSYSDIEYIVIDGLSGDNTMEIVEKYRKKIRKIISEKDKGLYDALNKGIALATGDVVGILHSDDFYTNNGVIQKYVDLFQKTGCEAVYSDLYYVDRGDTDKIIRKWKSGDYKPGAFINGWMPPHPTFFVKKKCTINSELLILHFLPRPITNLCLGLCTSVKFHWLTYLNTQLKCVLAEQATFLLKAGLKPILKTVKRGG